MMDYYCDISAVGNEYQSYNNTPTWGALATDKPLPMDGTGLAGPGHSAAVAIAEIKINALPADGNTLTIAGAVLTAKTAAAAKNQWTLGASIATCVTNLVALLNTYGTGTSQCDAAVSTSVCKLALALPYWQFARVKPGTTDTLQIATRIAGSDLNYSSNTFVALAQSGWATPPTLTQFAGGADGPFAYLQNVSTVFGKLDGQSTGTTMSAYGLFFNAAPGPSEPGVTDVVHCRSKRSGSNLSITYTFTGTPSVIGNWKSRNYLFDDGTVWSGDNGTLTVSWIKNVGNSQSIQANLNAGVSVALESRSKYNFELIAGNIYGTFTQGINAFVPSGNNTQLSFAKSKFTEHPSASNTSACIWYTHINNYYPQTIEAPGALFTFNSTISTTRCVIAATAGSLGRCAIGFYGTDVEVNAASVPIAAPIYVGAGVMLGPNALEWIGGSIRDSLGVYKCPNPINVDLSTSAVYWHIVVDGVDGVTDVATTLLQDMAVYSDLRWVSAEGANKGFRYACGAYSVDWKGDGTFPYAGAAANLAGDNWSHRVLWAAVPSKLHGIPVLRLPYFYRDAAATKTLKIALYVPDSTTLSVTDINAVVDYIDSGDVKRTEYFSNAPRVLAFSGSAPAAISSDSTTWTPNGVAGYSAKKLEMTTAYPIKQNSDAVVTLLLQKSQSPSVTIYVGPELVVS